MKGFLNIFLSVHLHRSMNQRHCLVVIIFGRCVLEIQEIVREKLLESNPLGWIMFQ